MQFLWLAAWVTASLRLLNLMAFHYWAAGGPPTPYPEWHEAWGNVFFSVAFGCWAIGGLGVWLMRDRRYATKHNMGQVVLFFSLVMALLIMGLAVWAVPGTGKLVLLTPAVLGAAWAFMRLRRSAGGK